MHPGHGLHLLAITIVTTSTYIVADQQKVEILRALGRESQLVVFDEPTARLDSHEALELQRTIRDLAARGVAVIYISHFLNEVLQVCDTITIMRDGKVVRTNSAKDETYETLVEGITGRSVGEMFPPKPPEPSSKAAVVLEVENLSRAGEFEDASFDRVVMGFGLRNVTDPARCLSEIHRVLRPGGWVVVLEFSQPDAWLSPLYHTYTHHVLPPLGKLVTGDADSYRYLAESIAVHPDQQTLREMMRAAGFYACQYTNISAGIVAIHRGARVTPTLPTR